MEAKDTETTKRVFNSDSWELGGSYKEEEFETCFKCI